MRSFIAWVKRWIACQLHMDLVHPLLRIAWIVLWVDDRRHQLWCQKALSLTVQELHPLDQLLMDGVLLMLLICVMECHHLLRFL